jgi:hypothetical protein
MTTQNYLTRLPQELIRYIYAFDDNEYLKKKYTNALSNMMQIHRKWKVCQYMSPLYSYYAIYKNHHHYYGQGDFSLSKYILVHNKNYGDKLLVITMNPSFVKGMQPRRIGVEA